MHRSIDTLYFRVMEPDSPAVPNKDNLPDEWKLEMTASRTERQTFYDTFENQAWQKGLLVVRKKGSIEVTSLETGKVIADMPFSKTPSTFFPTTLDDDKVKDLLLECGGLRAFTKNFSIDVDISSWKVLDDNRKTIAIINSESLQLADGSSRDPFVRFFSLSPLKGYHRELARMLRTLPEPLDAYRLTGFRERFMQIFEATGHPLGEYSAKLRLQLDPEATIHENIRRLLQFTSSVMLANETGIRKDIDTEFLHDYRVATRRARSILRQVKGVFEPHRTAWALQGLRELGKRSNRLRDCDVYLLRQAEYLDILPSELRPGLKRFFSTLANERREQHRRFCEYLASNEYRNFMQEWAGFISCEQLPDQETAPESAVPTRIVAGKAVRRAWKKVIVHGRRIGCKENSAELHELRIDCKRLRYILEFFSSLFPDKTGARLIGHLKELQENLGDFVDVSVQLTFMLERIELLATRQDEILQAASIGGLSVALYQRQEEARKQFAESFARFDDEQTRELFDEILTTLQ
ncbi:MAG: CHAD domain-containing protein [Chlorobiaceae bacterium]|nr:CHAD domain-containing protein [Chlorobiaceae bacterium]